MWLVYDALPTSRRTFLGIFYGSVDDLRKLNAYWPYIWAERIRL